MRLPARQLPLSQRRALTTIDRALEARDPRLASMFSMFAALSGEAGAPRQERLARRPPRLAALSASAGLARRAAVAQLALLACLMAVLVSFAIVGWSGSGCPTLASSDHAARRAMACHPASLPGK